MPMTIEERIKEIEGRLKADTFCLCGLPHCQKCMDAATFSRYAAQDITFLLSELKRCREALEQVSSSCVRDALGLCIRHDGCRVLQALHPEGVK